MKNDLNDLKKLTNELMSAGSAQDVREKNPSLINRIYGSEQDQAYEDVIDQGHQDSAEQTTYEARPESNYADNGTTQADRYDFAQEIEEEESLSIMDKEIELIRKSLERHKGKRKAAADDLGISERTLYRKIKQYDL